MEKLIAVYVLAASCLATWVFTKYVLSEKAWGKKWTFYLAYAGWMAGTAFLCIKTFVHKV